MYKSPIELSLVNDWITDISRQISEDHEMRVMAQVQSIVSVDKEELIKALNYDRNQYEKGFTDAKKALQPMCRHVGKCMAYPEVSREYVDWCSLYQCECNCQCIGRCEHA